MGGLFSKNRKLTDHSPLLRSSINFPPESPAIPAVTDTRPDDNLDALSNEALTAIDDFMKFKFEMYDILHSRSPSRFDRVILPFHPHINNYKYKAVILSALVLDIGCFIGLALILNNLSKENLRGSLRDKNFNAAISLSLVEVFCAVALVSFVMSLERHGIAMQARFNSMDMGEIKQLELSMSDKIDNLTKEKASNPRYREWLTFYIKNEKVNRPVPPYIEDDLEARPILT